jgi:hypothetical protein
MPCRALLEHACRKTVQHIMLFQDLSSVNKVEAG